MTVLRKALEAWNFRFSHTVEGAKRKGATQLIFAFGFTYADCLFSDVAAQKSASEDNL